MKKGLLCVMMLMLTLICVLASCGDDKDEAPAHTHNFGEWETVKVATCTVEGSKERYCSCGEKQTSAIIKTEHDYNNGVCTICGVSLDSNNPQNDKKSKYTEACALIESGNFERAYELLIEIGDYKDSAEMVARFRYVPIKSTLTYADGYYEVQELILGNNCLPTKQTYVSSDGDNYSHYYIFDANGRIIKESNQTLAREITNEPWTIDYTYDSNGNLTQEKYVSDDYWHSYDYTYNSEGTLIKESYTNSSGSDEYTYIYDNSGKLLKKEYNSYDVVYTYDSKGNLIKAEERNDSGSNYTTTYEYDNNDNLIRKYTTDNNDYWNLEEYTYNNKNYLVEEAYTSSYGSDSTYKYTYDSNGNETKYEYYDNKYGDYSTVVTTYNVNGKIIKEICTSSTTWENYICTYSYDSNGNLIKSTFESDGEIDVTTIEYKFVYIPYEWCDYYTEIFEEILDY